MWPWSKNNTSPSTDSIRETFFGDVPLLKWAGDGEIEPWTDFSRAATLQGSGDRDGAVRVLQAIVRRAGLESRHYLEAWYGLREAGVLPSAEEAKHVYGVVVDVPMKAGFDTLATYEDRKARYINFSGAAVIWDAPDSRMDGYVQKVLAAGQTLAQVIGPWEGARPPLTHNQARISLLTPSGLHFGQAPFAALARDAMGAPVIDAATGLMQALMAVAEALRGTA